MKRIFYPVIGLLIMILALGARADENNLRRVAEYHISAQDLVTFSRSGAKLKLCPDCEPGFYNFSSDFQLFEQEKVINIKRATELYIKKSYAEIFVAIDRQANTARYFRFGGHSDDR